MNEKNELKKQREQAEALRNRVELLKQQLQKEKETVRKHKQLTKQTIQKKIEVNKINQYVAMTSPRKWKTTRMNSNALTS